MPGQSAYWVSGVLITLAVILFATGSKPEAPRPGPAVFDRGALVPKARREKLSDPPMVKLGGYERDCMDCHQLFKNALPKTWQLAQHRELTATYDHGMNQQCADCHDREDRNLLTLGWGKTVDFSHSELLCARCHGPTYRDWQRSTHGKSFGSWRLDSDQRTKLTCVQCHEPHHPAYPKFKPLPGPNTLRMGEQHPHVARPESSLMWRAGVFGGPFEWSDDEEASAR